MQFEFPLQYPPQQKRTNKTKRAKFMTASPFRASQELLHELKLLGAENLIISSNLKPRLSGDGFYANQRVEDHGIAIYFKLRGDNKVMACDKWDRAEHNIWALYLSIQAIRGLERWGGSEFLDGLFSGFKALPAGDGEKATFNYFEGIEDQDVLKKKYRELAREFHPDMSGGDINKFKEMKTQYESLLKKL